MHHYLVAENRLLTPTVRSITLVQKDPTSKPLLYQPGQYATISLHDELRPTTTRCFSLSSSPTQGNYIQFSIRVNGKFTSALQRLKDGDEVVVRGPFGSFVFNEHIHRDVTFFAGGIGITPFMSMVRYACDTHASNKIHLVYSFRSEGDAPFLEELQKLKFQNPNLQVTCIVGDGSSRHLGERVFKGSLTDEVIDQLGLSFNTGAFMLCGPPKYMKTVEALLLKRKVPKSAIQTEAFSQGSSQYNLRFLSWPYTAHALIGLFFVLTLGYVLAFDFNKTIPKVLVINSTTQSDSNDVLSRQAGTISEIVNSVEPQVDTNITQEPVVVMVPNPNPIVYVRASEKPVVAPTPAPIVAPKPVTTVVPKPAPKPTPTPTVEPTTPPRSTVS